MCVCVHFLHMFTSQDSLDELEMDDYWKEVENITSSGGEAGRGEGGGEGEMQEEEQQKTPEGKKKRPGGDARFLPLHIFLPSHVFLREDLSVCVVALCVLILDP